MGAGGDVTQTPLRWRLIRLLLRLLVRRAARRVLSDRELEDTTGRRLRWLPPEIARFENALDTEAQALRPGAGLEDLSGFGNRLMVELAVFTVACDLALRKANLAPVSARGVVSDLAWNLYRRMLAKASLPARAVTRDPGRRLRWTLSILLRFPFHAPGAPGYAVTTRIEGQDIFTHFTHCPPQSYVRRLSEEAADPEVLEAFRQSWCRYDWAGADIIAGDGARGHYTRRKTLSHGDPVCDMCGRARAAGTAAHGEGRKTGRGAQEP